MKAHATYCQRTSPKLPCRRATGGFSLVEVVIAVAITALGVVTLLGLLPHGLELSRKTANELATTRIIQQLIGEVQSTDWTEMDAIGSGGNRLFDDQGIEITSGNDASTRTSYVANVVVNDPDLELPQPGSGVIQQHLRRVTVNIAAVPNVQFQFTDSNRALYRSYTQLVARMH